MKKIILSCLIIAFIISAVGNFIAMATTLSYSPVTPCRIVDTRRTSAGNIAASTQRNFRVFGSSSIISAQGGNPGGCPSPLGEPLAVHINMVAANPTGKGNMQAFPVGAGTGSGLSVNYNTIDTNLANAGTVKTVTGAGPDITVASNFSSAHAVIDVLGYYYPNSFAPVPWTGHADDVHGVPWPDPRFTDNGNGTVTDTLTGLIWLKNQACVVQSDWGMAGEACTNLAHGQCGLSDGSAPGDWRLPNASELYSLISYTGDERGSVLAPGAPFQKCWSCTGKIWSSTGWKQPDYHEIENVWILEFSTASGSVTGIRAVGIICFEPDCETEAVDGVWPVRGGN